MRTKYSILAISLPTRTLLKLLAEDEERMICDFFAVVGLPLALDPDDPDVSSVDRARDEANEGQDYVNPEVNSETLSKPNGDWREEEREDESNYLGGGILAHD